MFVWCLWSSLVLGLLRFDDFFWGLGAIHSQLASAASASNQMPHYALLSKIDLSNLSNFWQVVKWEFWRPIWGVHGPLSDSPSNGCRKVHSQSRIREFATCTILWTGRITLHGDSVRGASCKSQKRLFSLQIWLIYDLLCCVLIFQWRIDEHLWDQRYLWFDWVLSSCSVHLSSWNQNLRR